MRAADWSGLHFMVGAFLSGAVLDADLFDQEEMDFFRNNILLAIMPVFFLSTGLRTAWSMGGVAVFSAAAALLAARQQEKIERKAEKEARRRERMERKQQHKGKHQPATEVQAGDWPEEQAYEALEPEPDLDDERLSILRMVEQGQINPEEAEMLLDALR